MLANQFTPIRQRIESNVERLPWSGCWVWMGATSGTIRTREQRPVIRVNGKDARVYRMVYEQDHGPIPAGMMVCHHCDVPLCINPDHLFLGTASDNARDSVKKGRSALQRLAFATHCQRGHEFTAENTGRQSSGGRFCRACVKIKRVEQNRRAKAKAKARAALKATEDK